MSKPQLYSYFRSSCAWRVRIALALKGIDYETIPIHLVQDEQHGEKYLQLNPMGQVPTLIINGEELRQSLPIIEYLDEIHPKNPLLPKDPVKKAKVREVAEIIASGIQPLQNLNLIMKYSDDAKKRGEWASFWIVKGFKALEKILKESSGNYCFGNEITLADCCLVPQVYNAIRFNVNMDEFPTISKINKNLSELEPFKVSHPSAQIDCPQDLK